MLLSEKEKQRGKCVMSGFGALMVVVLVIGIIEFYKEVLGR